MKQRGKVRRIVIRASIFLLLGAIVNIAVAWGCVVLFDPFSSMMFWNPTAVFDMRGIPNAIVMEQRAFGSSIVNVTSCAGTNALADRRIPPIPLQQAVPSWLDDPVADEIADFALHIYSARGWPCLSLWGVQDTQNLAGSPTVARGAWETNFTSVRPNGSPIMRACPMRPIWPGFVVNTLFYAALTWLLFAAPFALRRWQRIERRWQRIERGLCPACAYPVGASPVCTECGKPVNPRTVLTP